MRRSPFLQLPTATRPANQLRTDPQHVRAQHAAGRRSGRIQLHRASAAWPAAGGVRGWFPDALVCHVGDLVDGLVRLMNSPPEVTGPISLGNPGKFTTLKFAQLVLTMVGGQWQDRTRPLPQDGPNRRCPEIDRAREVLGWQPSTPLGQPLPNPALQMRAFAEPLSQTLPQQRCPMTSRLTEVNFSGIMPWCARLNLLVTRDAP